MRVGLKRPVIAREEKTLGLYGSHARLGTVTRTGSPAVATSLFKSHLHERKENSSTAEQNEPSEQRR